MSAEQSIISITIANPNPVSNPEIRWTLRLRVIPETEPSFEANLTAVFPESTRPRPGMRLAVIYDPKDHNRIELDHQRAAAADVGLDAVTAAAQPDLADAQVMGMPLGDIIRQAMADPNALREEIMRRGMEMQDQAVNVVWSSAPPQSSDPIDRLERLAALKERGMLTDAEFEQQKRRILGT
ncbi:SHOCT domain-containing protein [Mycobacterium ostraviense]|uniref:SHOCT domain-containing protein n=1 Tax=Mycobacterium ostraviense TaxID=2738409 RepID=UPI001E5A0B4A|nr:SHOCT domain-containing protein [Mycobacterium ostraviense]UGT92641.1 SHOCT domain-containing protein [Mycobacterium ostraviense]